MSEQTVVIYNLLPDLKPLRILKKYLKYWKIYTTHKLNRQRAVHKAVYSYNVRLKQRTLNSFFENCIEAKRTQSTCEGILTESNDECPDFQTAIEFEHKKILKRVFHFWLAYTEHRQRKKALNAKISDIRNDIFLSKYIKFWKFIWSEKKHNAEREKKVIEFHRHILLRKFLRLWIKSYNHRLSKKIKWENAIFHFRRKLLMKIWFSWIKYSNTKIERVNRIYEIREFYEKKILARSLKILSSNVFAAVEKRRLIEIATNHYKNRLSTRIFLAWITHHRKKNELKNKIKIQRRKFENSSKQHVLNQWRLYVWTKKCSRRKNNISINHHNRKLVTKTMIVLKNYLLYRKKKEISLSYLKIGIAQISFDILRRCVDKWQIAVIFVAQERQKILRAKDHWSSRHIKRYFFIWREFSERYKLHSKRKDALNKIGKTVQLNKYMDLWFKKYEAVAMIRTKEIWVESIYVKKIQSRLFQSWKRYIDEMLERRAEIDEAEKFHRKILLREGLKETLKICMYMKESRYENRLRCVKKSSIEDFEILRKYFDRWLTLVCCNENGKSNVRINFIKKNENFHGISCLPKTTRLVLPEYMLKKTNLETNSNGDFHGRNKREDTFEFREFEKRHMSSWISKSSTPESFPSSHEKSTDLPTGTYSIRKCVDVEDDKTNSLHHFQNSSFRR